MHARTISYGIQICCFVGRTVKTTMMRISMVTLAFLILNASAKLGWCGVWKGRCASLIVRVILTYMIVTESLLHHVYVMRVGSGMLI